MGGRLENVRIDLVGGILSHHVLDRLVTSRVEWNPSIDLENTVVEDEHMFPVGNEALDVAARQNGVLAGDGHGGAVQLSCGI